GIMHKQRGVSGRSYNLYNNPQAEKHLLQNPDAKNLTIICSLDSQNTPTQQNSSEAIDAFLKTLASTAAQQNLELKDLLINSPFFRDHLSSQPIDFNQVILINDSYLPTNGPKAI